MAFVAHLSIFRIHFQVIGIYSCINLMAQRFLNCIINAIIILTPAIAMLNSIIEEGVTIY